jgi:hypothetical protein
VTPDIIVYFRQILYFLFIVDDTDLLLQNTHQISYRSDEFFFVEPRTEKGQGFFEDWNADLFDITVVDVQEKIFDEFYYLLTERLGDELSVESGDEVFDNPVLEGTMAKFLLF